MVDYVCSSNINKMRSDCVKVDKSVSTEDSDVITRTPIALDYSDSVKLEVFLAALVHSKVTAMKSESEKSKLCSNNSSPKAFISNRLRRITKSVTSSPHKEKSSNNVEQKGRKENYKRKYDSSNSRERRRRHGGGRERARGSDSELDSEGELSPSRQRRKRRDRRHRRRHNVSHCLSDPRLVHAGNMYVAELSTSYSQGSLYTTQPLNPHMKINYDEDYVSVNVEDFAGGDCEAIMTIDTPLREKRKRRARRKRHKKRRLVVKPLEIERVKVIDPDDLSQRARWTIIATAFLLLVMCLLLVGVTLRMAPIIDDMVRQENERLQELQNQAAIFTPNSTSHSTLDTETSNSSAITK